MDYMSVKGLFWSVVLSIFFWVAVAMAVILFRDSHAQTPVVEYVDGVTSAALQWDHSGENDEGEYIDSFQIWSTTSPGGSVTVDSMDRELDLNALSLPEGETGLVVSAVLGEEKSSSDPLTIMVVNTSSSSDLTAGASHEPATGEAPLAVQLSGAGSGGEQIVPLVDIMESELVDYVEAQNQGGVVTVSPDGLSLDIVGNIWVAIPLDYTITPETMLEFDFSSSSQGEIHGIGMDNQIAVLDTGKFFQIYGTQTNVGEFPPTQQAFYNYQPPGAARYSIPIGQYYTGVMTHLVIASDHDVATPTIQSTYSDIAIYEPGDVDYTYSWDLGNGCTSNDQNPLATYAYPGTYTATLTVSDGASSAMDSVEIVVSAPPAQCQ